MSGKHSLFTGESCSIEAAREGDSLRVRIKGVLDEDVDLRALFQLIQAEGAAIARVEFDLSKVSRINSCGVRSWILALNRIQEGHPCRIQCLSTVFAQQAAVTTGVLGEPRVEVQEFVATYVCDSCNLHFDRVLKVSDVSASPSGESISFPSQPCEYCSKPMRLENPEEEYAVVVQGS